MKAKVQGRFPFKGKMRNPGDVLDEQDLDGVSQTVLDAMVSQKLIVLDPSESVAAKLDDFERRIAALEDIVTASSAGRRRAQS